MSSNVCDPYSGDCPCAEGFAGPACDQCARGYFQYPLCQRCLCIDVGTTDEVCYAYPVFESQNMFMISSDLKKPDQ